MIATDKPPNTRRKPYSGLERLQAKTLYIRGAGSLRVLSEKTGISIEALKDWSQAEGWTDLREEYERRQIAKLLGPDPTTPPVVQTPENQAPPVNQSERLSAQMREIEEQMRGMTNADSLSKLAMAHSKLFDAWCVLTGTPRPGVRKVGKLGRLVSPVTQPTEPTEATVSQPVANQPNLI